MNQLTKYYILIIIISLIFRLDVAFLPTYLVNYYEDSLGELMMHDSLLWPAFSFKSVSCHSIYLADLLLHPVLTF